MTPYLVPKTNASYLDEYLLDDKGLLKVMPSSFYREIPQADLAYWCHNNAVYGLPTHELVWLIQKEIAGKKAIEIGAGNGCLGRALGIPITDSCIQASERYKDIYDAAGQPTIKYPKDIIKMTAEEALDHYKPEVVVASWVTQKWRKGQKDGFQHGVNEEALLRRVEKYIFFGNHEIHRHKIIGKYPLTAYTEENQCYFFSRSMHTSANVLYIWPNILRVHDLETRTCGTMNDITSVLIKPPDDLDKQELSF